ncbi:MAG: SRPBCC family protein [Actinomycetia bacterium]|nr:SRPBCC family protein [Actinomycetes bacterium]
MMNLDVSRDVSAPADIVWTIMTDLENSVDTISAIQSVEILSEPQAFAVGTKWRETRTMFGKRATEEMWVTEVDPGTSYMVAAESHGARYTTIMKVIATGEDSSRISMNFGAEPTGTMAKVMGATIGKLFESATRKAIAHDLDDIAAAAEARS